MEEYNTFTEVEMRNGQPAILYSEKINSLRVDGIIYASSVTYPKDTTKLISKSDIKWNDVKISFEIIYNNKVMTFSNKNSFDNMDIAKEKVINFIGEIQNLNPLTINESLISLLNEKGFIQDDLEPYISILGGTSEEIFRKNHFISKAHLENFLQLGKELDIALDKDVYWASLVFLISGNQRLFKVRQKLINFNEKRIESEFMFSGYLSGGEQKLLKLGYNLFTNRSYFEDENEEKHFISPLDIFSGLDSENYKLAINSISVRLEQ